MKRLSLFVALTPCTAHRLGAGQALRGTETEIAAKIDANGVKKYTLEIVANDQVGERKVVGSCEGGTKKIVYVRQ